MTTNIQIIKKENNFSQVTPLYSFEKYSRLKESVPAHIPIKVTWRISAANYQRNKLYAQTRIAMINI